MSVQVFRCLVEGIQGRPNRQLQVSDVEVRLVASLGRLAAPIKGHYLARST